MKMCNHGLNSWEVQLEGINAEGSVERRYYGLPALSEQDAIDFALSLSGERFVGAVAVVGARQTRVGVPS